MNATKPTETKPFLTGELELGKVTIICDRPGLAERVELCYNACSGLTAEQVVEIPAKLKAFEMLRKAMNNLLDNLPEAITHRAIYLREKAYVAVKLCEAQK